MSSEFCVRFLSLCSGLCSVFMITFLWSSFSIAYIKKTGKSSMKKNCISWIDRILLTMIPVTSKTSILSLQTIIDLISWWDTKKEKEREREIDSLCVCKCLRDSVFHRLTKLVVLKTNERVKVGVCVVSLSNCIIF